MGACRWSTRPPERGEHNTNARDVNEMPNMHNLRSEPLDRSPQGDDAARAGQHRIVGRMLVKDLVDRGFLSHGDVEAVLTQADSRVALEALLLGKYGVPKPELGLALSAYYGCPYAPYDERVVVDPELLKDLSLDYLRKSAWVPVLRVGAAIHILMNDPHDFEKAFDIRRAFPGCTIRMTVGLQCDIEQYLSAARQQRKHGSIAKILGELIQGADGEALNESSIRDIDENDCAIVRLANHIISEADRAGASDVHIEPYAEKKETAVRFRVDGSCFTYMRIPAAYRRAIVSRFKIMANLDIAERRKPQDGKIRYSVSADRKLDLRVATLPTAGANEDVVMRLLTSKEIMSLEAMDFSPDALQAVQTLVNKPHGIILCVGPTGSGKTTTLHAMLKSLNTDERKIWTAEDPIEITQDGLRQVQVHPKIGFTFAAAMRAFLRADPDVIMIGEMRDRETADIAIEASLTGHLVLSTLHTNSAVETVTRLLDIGCDSYNFADAMIGVLAQRLCKRICVRCKEAYRPTREEYEELVSGYGPTYWHTVGMTRVEDCLLYRGRGCESCNRTGFYGRLPIHELLVASRAIKNLIQSKAKTADILHNAMQEGMVTLVQDGIQKALQGLTTYRQVRAVAAQ